MHYEKLDGNNNCSPAGDSSTGSYQLETVIENALFLGTYEISKDYMKRASQLYHPGNEFRFPEYMEIELYII